MDRLEFKDQVVKLLNNCNSIPYLFIGSGLSFRYINTERWEELLKIFSDQVDISPTKFPYYKHQASSSINAEEELLYPKIATLIENDYNSYFLGTGKVEEKYLKDIEKISYFKLKIAEHFDNKFKFEYTEDQSLLEEIEMLKKLSISNIIGIITTNYDIFLEKLFEDFSVFIGQEELIFNPLVGMGNIYKIHG